MARHLVIAEKPSVARDIARALATTGERFTALGPANASQNFIVAAARGHLLAEVAPDAYDPKYKAWRLEDLPIIPRPPKFIPRDRDSATLLKQLVELARRDDVIGLVNACDAGREGELIFALVYDHLGVTKPVRRAWFSSMTTEAVVEAFGSLRPASDFAGLQAAARSRSSADWVVGINATRAASVRLGRRDVISLGRVQTPTLALVARRDEAIDAFVPTDFYTVRADCAVDAGAFTATWFRLEDGEALERFDVRADADEVARRCTGRPASVSDVTRKDERVKAPRLFDLTTLQQEANKRFGFTAARTLAAAQELYESHKLLTYPRTDSNYLTSDMATQIPAMLSAAAHLVPDLAAHVPAITAAGAFAVVINDAKVSDHHAIVPTGDVAQAAALPEDVRKVLELVCRRTVAALLPAAELTRTRIVVTTDTTDTFAATGTVMNAPGWKIAYPGPGKAEEDADAEGDKSQALPHVTTGQAVTLTDVSVHTGTTKAPAAYTEASLLASMSTAGRLVDDEELAEAMKESGLGTPATRADTIERLIKADYLTRSRKALKATTKGRSIIALLDDHPLTSPALTGEWEARLRRMEKLDASAAPPAATEFSEQIASFTTDIVAWFRTVDASGFTSQDVLGPCPIDGCAGSIVDRPKSYSCDSWRSKDEPGCGYAIWKQQGGRKVTRAQALAQLAVAPAVLPARRERVPVAECPSPGCGGTIVEREKSFGCDSWRSKDEPGCGWVLWRSPRTGPERSREDVLAAIRNGVNDARPPVEQICPCPMPRCKGAIVERAKSFSCTSWSPTRKGCGLVVWKTDRSGVAVATRENLEQLLPAAVADAQSRKTTRR